MTITAPTSTHDADRPEPAPTRAPWTRDGAGLLRLDATSSWRDRLVDLVVLAEHGDEVAARHLGSWLRDDVTVQAAHRRLSDDVEAVRGG